MRIPRDLAERLRELMEEIEEQLGMYTGLTEPLDFDQNDGAKRAERMGSRKDRS